MKSFIDGRWLVYQSLSVIEQSPTDTCQFRVYRPCQSNTIDLPEFVVTDTIKMSVKQGPEQDSQQTQERACNRA